MSTSAPQRHHILLLVGLTLLAFNLRPAAVSVGPVLSEVRADLGFSDVTAGILTSLPVAAFALVGALAPWLARTFGLHRVSLASLVAVVAGLLARVSTHDQWLFLLWTLVAVSGMACANVLAPSLVKLHFPTRIGTATAIYTTSLAVGLTLSLTTTVPISEAAGSWRIGLGVWAFVALLAIAPWIPLVAHDRRPGPAVKTITFSQVARTRLGWAMAGFFGVQSAIAYSMFGWFALLWRDNGYTPTEAGALVGVIAGVSIPLSLVLPGVVAKAKDQRPVIFAVLACYPIAIAGLLLAPDRWGVAWAVLLGAGGSIFPLILVLISLRAKTSGGTAALSGFTQSVGYLIAAPGPFLVGMVHGSTGGWTWPLVLVGAMLVPLFALGAYVARATFLEDQLTTAQPTLPNT